MADRRQALALAPSEEHADFGELYARYRAPLFSYIYRLVGDREQAADLLQETFVKVYRALDKMPDGSGRTPWVYRIATNTCYDVLRRRRLISWLPWSHDSSHPEPAVSEDNAAERFAVREDVEAALRLVPPTLRAPLLLHSVHGFSYADIAVALDTSEAAIKMRVSRARAAFRRAYGGAMREETQ